MKSSADNTPWHRLVGVGIALAAVVGTVLLAFLWPAATAEPNGLPVAVAGPPAQSESFEQGLESQAPGRFAFSTVSDRESAVLAIETREVYGAIVLGQSPEILVSSAANSAVAGQLGNLAPTLAENLNAALAAQGQTPPSPVTVGVTDVVPLVPSDANGVVISASAFPLVLGGVIGGVAIALGVIGIWRRLTALLVFSVVGGLSIAGILQGWFGGLQGEYLANVGAVALSLIAIGGVVIGLAGLLGRPGLALGAIVFVLFANPISGSALPLEFIVRPWGEIGQWFPPGAASTLLRDLSYFPKADALFPWMVLTGWAVTALALVAAGRSSNRSNREIEPMTAD